MNTEISVRNACAGYNLLVISLFLPILLILMPLARAADASEIAGRVIVTIGKCVARNSEGDERALKRRSPVYASDTVLTGRGARAQIRFTDGSLVSLRPDSELRIREYHYAGKADGTEKGAYSLLKGGMRTISGVIGKKHKENYEVTTPVATIGIRGTDYEAVLDNGLSVAVWHGGITVTNDAAKLDLGVQATYRFAFVPSSSEAPRGLMTPPNSLGEPMAPSNDSSPETDKQQEQSSSSEEGSQSDSGSTAEADEQSASSGTAAEQGEVTSDGANADANTGTWDTDEGGSLVETTTDDGLSDGVTESPATSDPTDDATYQVTEDVNSSGTSTAVGQEAPIGAAMAVGFVNLDSTEGYHGSGGLVVADGTNTVLLSSVGGADNIPVQGTVYFAPHSGDPSDTGCNPCTFSRGTATLSDAGGDASYGSNWGRWNGDFIVVDNGTVDQTAGAFHYIYSPNITPLSTIHALTGNFTYVAIPGAGTAPTDESGAVGTLNAVSFDVDFTNQVFTNGYLDVTISGRDLYLDHSSFTPVPIDQVLSGDADIALTGTCSGSCGSVTNINGNLSIDFVGPNAERALGSYGISADSGPSTPSTFGVTGTAYLQKGAM